MYMLRIIVALTGIFCLVSVALSDVIPRSCSRPGPRLCRCRCSKKFEPVWATDHQKCCLLRNACVLDCKNCIRLKRGQQLLKVVSRKQCEKYCPKVCNKIYDPVCAEYNCVKKEFGNQCLLESHICATGQTYRLLYKGKCEKK